MNSFFTRLTTSHQNSSSCKIDHWNFWYNRVTGNLIIETVVFSIEGFPSQFLRKMEILKLNKTGKNGKFFPKNEKKQIFSSYKFESLTFYI